MQSVAYRRKDLRYSTRAKRTFTEHIFMPRCGMKFHYSDSCAFLTPVVLFLHEQIQLIETIGIGSVFLLVVA